ncbi:hypothetical protein [Burkholderia gladioli]|uniref:hypothetical protein n=1 Tax=Burkholderia gladioli TaxID=28095 RepID=UPI0015E434C5|nr:hypothetical protein [Burkholderia gladioli]MBU9174693.1 hypothetical protein [Burkholderia gladioli]
MIPQRGMSDARRGSRRKNTSGEVAIRQEHVRSPMRPTAPSAHDRSMRPDAAGATRSHHRPAGDIGLKASRHRLARARRWLLAHAPVSHDKENAQVS